MWVFIFLLDLLGRKNFLRFLAGWTLIMLFFIPFSDGSPSDHTSPGRCNACYRSRTLAPAFNRGQGFLDGSFNILVLSSLIPLMR
jgi:hypothetical protein